MKIIIPMSGMGRRFTEAGYADPKPLVRVDGKPMIEHLVSLFSSSDDFIFICNKNHSQNEKLMSVLRGIPVNKKILEIYEPLLGPVNTVLHALHEIDDEEPVIVNYCDFGFFWNYDNFKKRVRESNCDAAVTAYTGFHPHLLGKDVYASMRVDGEWMLECREKHSFTQDKMDTFHQSGTFYFSSGELVKKFFPESIRRGLLTKNEFYVSMVTQLMVESGLRVLVYPLAHFLQWGTPEHLQEYMVWSDYFAGLAGASLNQSNRKPDVGDKRQYDYWESFFSKCKWHPYGKAAQRR